MELLNGVVNVMVMTMTKFKHISADTEVEVVAEGRYLGIDGYEVVLTASGNKGDIGKKMFLPKSAMTKWHEVK